MAFEIPGFKHSLVAFADLSLGQYHAVRVGGTVDPITGTARVIIQTQAGDDSTLGILQNKPNAQGEAAEIMSIPGITKWVAGEAINAGELVSSNASGRCRGALGGDVVLGHALQASSANGDLISVLLGVTFIQIGG